MNPQDEHPNPVEDYMREIMGSDTPGKKDSVSVPVPNIPASEPRTEEELQQQNHIMENAKKRRRPVFDPTGRIEHIDENETEIADIRRHLIGLVIMYAQFIIASALIIGLLAFLLPDFLGDSAGSNMAIGLLVLLMTVIGAVFLILATRIYKGNQLIVTDLHVTEVQQLGLFNRKVSELSMANVEDVTSNTDGILPTIFNYGTLTIETAGEQHNFVFKFCPNPGAYAKALQDARSEYLKKYASVHGAHIH